MTRPQEPRRRARSAFTAAFLSLLFPGLGHAYAGAWYRALGFAAAPFLLLALGLGVVAGYRLDLVGVVLQPAVLVSILVGNVVALLYRAIAAVDAYRVALYLNRWDEGAGRLGASRSVLAPDLGRGPARRPPRDGRGARGRRLLRPAGARPGPGRLQPE